MKIAVCTPLHVQSAIGRVSINITDELTRRGHLVTLINIERDPSPATQSSAQPQYSWKDPDAIAVLHAANAIVVQIGDNYGYHAGAIHILNNFHCVGIFHDANIYNLFRMWAFDGRSDADGKQKYDTEISRVYGNDLTVKLDESNPATRFDMISWLAAPCAAALVHANFYIARVQDSCPGTDLSCPLTYDARAYVEAEQQDSKSRLTILTLGHINPNKCCDQVIKAIGQSELRSRSEYRIVGPISKAAQDHLTAIASEYGVQATLSGRVTDADIALELRRADIVCCLRRPILEGASASAIEAMLSGRAIIVPNAGFYAEIDDAGAVKVPADFTIDDIRKALELLADQPDFRHDVAARGKNWATKNCSVQSYVDCLEKLLNAAVSVGPYLDLARTYAGQLTQLGFGQNDPIFFRVADCLQGLCEIETD